MSRPPEQACKEESENKVEECTCRRDNYFVCETDRRQFYALVNLIGRIAAFHPAHFRELGQCDVAAERKPGNPVVHYIAGPAHHFRAHPNREAGDFESSLACGEEMPELMNED